MAFLVEVLLTSRSVYSSALILEQSVKISKIVGFDIFREHVHRRGLKLLSLIVFLLL